MRREGSVVREGHKHLLVIEARGLRDRQGGGRRKKVPMEGGDPGRSLGPVANRVSRE